MKYRLIVSDIDGTLTSVWDKVNDYNREVLRKLVKQGVHFMIATGRSYRSAQGILKSLDIPCYACLVNGAVLLSYPDVRLMHANYLSVEEKNLLISKIHQVEGHAVMYNGFEAGDKVLYTGNYHLSPILKRIIEKERNETVFVEDMITEINHPVPVISCVGTFEEIAAIQEILIPYRDEFNILHLKDTYFENNYWLMISRKSVDKVHGIQTIADHLGVSREEIIAIGDDLNDLEMIKFAGLGIAMDNGRNELKEVADMIAPQVDEDGLGKILEEIYAI